MAGGSRHLVLVGLMGSGKSTVARQVARRTGRRAVDLDADVETAAGCSIPELFATQGEDAFRRRETEALQQALAAGDPTVIATGGGVVVRPENRRLLSDASQAIVVWLDATSEALLERVGHGGSGRPLLAHDPEATLRRLHDERAEWYAEVAHHRVDTSTCTLDHVVDAVCEVAGSAVSAPGEGEPLP